jgi:serine/alanine adding enzyme
LNLIKNSEISLQKWEGLLSLSPYASAFQTPAFYELFNSVQGFAAEVYAVEEDSKVSSLCIVTIQRENGIKGYFSRRAIIYGGPLFIGDNYETVKHLMHHICLELSKRVIFIEVRNYADYNKLKPIYINSGWQWLPYLDIRLSLKGKSLEEVLGLMRYNRKREIKLSLAEGAFYREAKDESEIEVLYLIIKDLYRERVKLPVPDLDFFLALFKSTIGKVFVTLHNNKIIGGSFCFYIEDKSISTMYYCGLREYHKKIFPTHLSVMAAIDFGIRNKLEYINFMGAGLRSKEYGVRKYKQGFGGELLEFGRFRKINNTFLFAIGEFGLRILKLFEI